jgi:serine/threonine protein kinase
MKATHARQAYLNEVVVWQHLRHPNIVHFLGTVGGQDLEVAFISEWMDGGTVREFLRNEPEYDRSALACIFFDSRPYQMTELLLQVRDIVCGLAFMHSLDVIHGDVKPVSPSPCPLSSLNVQQSNILIDCRHRARLADFGLARITTVTTSGSTSDQSGGSTRYMAPELFQPRPTSTTSVGPEDGLPTKQSDVYALGVSTWEVCKSCAHISTG